MHHQFVASAKAVKLAHEKYPEYLIGDMNVFMTKYPFTCNPEDVLATQKEMRIMNWFCSDMHVRGEYPYYMKRFFAEHNITIHQEPEDAAILKAGTVDLRVEEGEIQTAILIPKESYDRCYGHYIKYAMRNAMDIATLGPSVNVRLSADKRTVERSPYLIISVGS